MYSPATMRLTPQQKDIIQSTIAEADPVARAFLFGSRTDDLACGGDIDILCFSQKLDRHDRRRIKRTLCDRLGEQKIDLIVTSDTSSPFVRLVMPQAIPLS